jgi:small subunit ribosomal protein S17
MNTRRRITGVVTSNKMQKTVVVEISRTYRHRLYKKVVDSSKHVMAHDELGCQIGDHVRIVESQPISRRKRWVVEEILRREIGADEPEDDLMEAQP